MTPPAAGVETEMSQDQYHAKQRISLSKYNKTFTAFLEMLSGHLNLYEFSFFYTAL